MIPTLPLRMVVGVLCLLALPLSGLAAALPQVARPANPVSIEDLLRLRDLGGFSPSPDGRWIAYSLREATADLADYRVRWFIIPANGKGASREIDVPEGQPITADAGGLRSGHMPAASLLWSPDGQRFAFRRREGDAIELWSATPLGKARRVAPGTPQVDSFAWTSEGRLVYRTGLDAAAFERARRVEARHGWLLDHRMVLWAARTPAPLAPNCPTQPAAQGCEVAAWVADRETIRPASPEEAQWLTPAHGRQSPEGAGVFANGERPETAAWSQTLRPEDDKLHQPFRRVWAARGSPVVCPDRACAGQFINALGWARHDRSVWILKRISEDADRGPFDRLALLEWRPGHAKARTVLETSDVLGECQARGVTLYCRRSAAAQPDTIVGIDLDNGRVASVLDPNPDFAAKDRPRIRQLVLEGPDGDRGFAQLVYPNDYRPGQTYPAVVVQYRARGFLRGGTGGDYPILPLSAAGFFVLSVDMPDDVRAWRTLDLASVMLRERLDRRGQSNAAGAVAAALDRLAAEGLVDPHRTCITGLSYGAEIVHYALQHSDRYACALASQAAMDVSYLAQFPDTPERKTWMDGLGAESLVPTGPNVIRQTAWSQQPDRLRTPLLLNVGQDEALLGFEGVRVLQFNQRPIEVRVFPDEGHIKYRPESLLGVYENSLMWLRFWLQDIEDPRPEFHQQYERWRGMRTRVNELRAPPRA